MRRLAIRKAVALVLALVLVLLVSPLVGEAGFSDVSGHWAFRYVLKMNLKGVIAGYPDGTFRPDRSVSRLEAIIMAVRVLGLEEEAKAKADSPIPASFKNPEFIPDWAKGYVSVAVSEGIIAGTDLENFRPTHDAKRYEVAVFMVRAMGLSSEAQAKATSPLSFSDASSVPAWARGYVAVAAVKGIIVGNPDGSFKPNDPITRAAMATILSRVDNQMDTKLDEAQEVKGTLVAVSLQAPQSMMVRKADGITSILPVVAGALVYRDDVKGSLGDLKPGDSLTITLDSSGKVAYIEAEKDGNRVRGTITALVSGPVPTVMIKKPDGAQSVYYLSPSATIKVEGATATFAQLVQGQEVTLEVDGNTALAVDAKGVNKKLTGRVIALAVGTPSMVSLRTEDNAQETYIVAQGATVTKDGKSSALSAIRIGDRAEIEVVASKVTSISARTMDREFTGVVTAIQLSPTPSITVRASDGREETYPIGSNANVKRNGYAASLADVKLTDQAFVDVEDGYVVLIEAESVRREAKGTVRSITIADKSTITIKTKEGQEETIPLSRNVVIKKGLYNLPLADVKVGYFVQLVIEGDEAVRMDVEARETLDETSGTVAYINLAGRLITLEGTGQAIYVGGAAVIVKHGSVQELSRLEVGDRIFAAGRLKAGLFEASVVVVTSSVIP